MNMRVKFWLKSNISYITAGYIYSDFMILHSVVTFDETMPSDHMLTSEVNINDSNLL